MKFINILLLSLGMVSLSTQAVEITITNPEPTIKMPEEEKPAIEKPDLPEPFILKINAINQTEYNFAIDVRATAKDIESTGIIIQNQSSKSSLQTLGTLTAAANATFKFNGSLVIATSPVNSPISCEIKKTEEEATEPAPVVAPIPTHDEASITQAPESGEIKEEAPVAKQSIDFYFYIPKGQYLPKCAILFDSLKL